MDDLLTLSLIVSGIGMALLFAALFALYGLMYLMTAVIKDRPAAAVPVEEEPAEEDLDEAKRMAAVVAVAMARAERESFASGAPPEEVSPWWALHLHRQLTNRIPTRSTR
ncbi:MAG TPA: hypothetical protein EYH27_04825 [Anaerolineales bacterium]|nr:hypothetical protein [Anaerolineae bacterium]HIP87744.1 hypothetical protein [Anaerolineales bacterium]